MKEVSKVNSKRCN